MSQYDVAKLVYESEEGITREELVRRIDLSKGAIVKSIHDLLRKEYIIEKSRGIYVWNTKNSKNINNLEPRPITEFDF